MYFDKGVENPETDYIDLMELALSRCNENDIFVEVGVFLGESISRLIQESNKLNKKISINAVDLFGIGDLLLNHKEQLIIPIKNKITEWKSPEDGDNIFPQFIDFLRKGDKLKYLNSIIISDANSAARLFGDKSVFFCFIDAGHSYDDVFSNLCNWYPKIKYGGILCGHDYINGQQIKEAVHNFAEKYNLKLNFVGQNFTFFI